MLARGSLCCRCACRAYLVASPRGRGSVNHQVARFASLTDGADAADDARRGRLPETAGDNNGQIANHAGGPNPPPKPRHKISPKKLKSQKPARSTQDAALALFNDVVKPSTKTKFAPKAPEHSKEGSITGSTPAAAVFGEWELASKIKEIADKNVGPQQKLQLFKSEVWPQLQQMRGRMPKHLYLSTTQFLNTAINTATQDGHTSDNVALSRMLEGIGKLDLDARNSLVLNMCHQLIDEKHTSGERNVMLQELVGLWQHVTQLKRKSHERHPDRLIVSPIDDVFNGVDWSNVQDTDGASQLPRLTLAIASIFTQFRPEQARELVPGLLATIAVLSDPRLSKRQVQMKMAPLLNLAASALSRGHADVSYIDLVFKARIRFPTSRLKTLHSYVTSQWQQAMDMLADKEAMWKRGLSHPSRSESAASSALGSLHKQLRAAYRSRNTGAMVSIWQDLKKRLAENVSMGRQLREEAEFLDFWIFVWCAVRRSGKLQETLDLMQELKIQPTVKSYTAMMHGWKMCRDADRIEALWDKLVEANIRLDVVIWTERISGLIEAGKPQAGIQALAQMMAIWKAAHNKGDTMAVQPSIEVVNAAFKGLIRLDLNAANEVLTWAAREGIEPNIRTYNILLRESFRSDTPDDVQSLLKAMKKQGIDPDAATFTIILEEVLGAMDSATAAEQVAAVEQIFADIGAAGLRPNLETYGKMLYAVASLANGADEAIETVQAHMRSSGFSATPHMVTILIERALGRDPPDMAAIKALLQEHELTDVSRGDQTLWERVMSAHAVTGDTPQAMTVFNDLARAGRPVTSLPCLTDLLKALIGTDCAAEARSVVNVVLQSKMRSREEPRDRYWRHHFWYLAKEHGLLDWDQVPEDLRRRLDS